MKKRLLSILLASLLCAGSVSCSGKAAEENASADGGTPPDQTVTAAPETPAPETEPEEETISPDLPGELDYGGETVHIVKNPLVLLREFNTEELTGEVVDDALYNSYTAVCERLNVDFELIDVESSNSKQAAYVSAITKSVQSASGAYDFISGYSMCFPTLAAQGMLNDLLPTEYIDMEKPWWSSQLVKQSAVNGKLFFATGDISNQLLYNRDSISFDFGRVFNSMLSSITWQMFRGVVNGTGNWSSTLASNLKMLDKMLGKLIEKFE